MLSVFLYASANYKFSRKMNLICVILSIISLLFCCIIFIINKNFQKQENEIISLQSELDEHIYIGKTKNKILDLILDRYTSICNKRKINLIVDIRASI